MVGHAFGSLDRGDIGVHQNRLDALFPQGLEGLRAAVVELARLPDLQGAGAQQEHFPYGFV